MSFADINAARAADDVIEADASMQPNSRNMFNYIKADLGPSAAERLQTLAGSRSAVPRRAGKKSAK